MNALLSILFIFASTPSSQSSGHAKSIPIVDALIPRLQNENWSDEEKPCLDATLRILNGVKNDTLWATWVWDSMQPPVGVFYGSGMHMGSFDQCLNNPYSSDEKYCLVKVKAKETAETRDFQPYDGSNDYLNTIGKKGWTFNHHGFGACVPSSCSPSAIAKFFKLYIQMTHLPDWEVTLEPDNCHTREPETYSWRFYAFSYFLVALAATVMTSTIYSYYNDGKENSVFDSIAKSFCIRRNYTDLFKVNNNEIRVLNGMRFLTAVTVIALHHAVFYIYSPSIISNTLKFDKFFNTYIGQSLLHLDVVVDTFFALSGLLLTRGLLSGRQRNLFIVLVKRYFRLIGPYAFVTFYIMAMAVHTGTGPMWHVANNFEGGVCEDHWWKNFFMISTDFRTMCFSIGWYVACDFHLAILSIILLWIYRKNNRAGIIAFIGALSILTLQLGVMAYLKRLPLIPFKDLHKFADARNMEVFQQLYIKWEDRAGSYLVGMAMGWLIAKYKPADYRNTFSKATSFVIFSISLYVMMKVATIDQWAGDSGRLPVAVAIATNRIVWAVALCALIGAFEYGSVPVVADFLGCSAFVPLSKLSYGIYMIHFFVLQRIIHTNRSPLWFDLYVMAVCVPGIAVLASIASLILHLLVEAPLINMSNKWLSERDVKVEQTPIEAAKGSIYLNGNTKFKGS